MVPRRQKVRYFTLTLETFQKFTLNEEFERLDLKKLTKEVAGLKEKYLELDRQVNKDAESMRTHLEEQMKDLLGREETLNENKQQIDTNIEHLDDRSEDSVKECFDFVNR